MRHFIASAALAAVLVTAFDTAADAGTVLFTADDVDGDVVFAYAGDLDLSMLTLRSTNPTQVGLNSGLGYVNFGSGDADLYDLDTGFRLPGAGRSYSFPLTGGAPFYFGNGLLGVPAGFLSGTLSGSLTVPRTTLASLQFYGGTFVATLGGNTITAIVNAPPEPAPDPEPMPDPVPLPASLPLIAAGLSLLGLLRRGTCKTDRREGAAITGFR